MSEPLPPEEDPSVWSHLSAENQSRLTVVLREHVPQVFKANRVIEARTGYASAIAGHNLVDVLSHLGVLAAGVDLDSTEQASALSKMEEHLKRALIEHPEEVVRNRLGDVKTLWQDYHLEAFPYREEKALHGVPRHQELEELRSRIDALMESARSAKPEETRWEETLTAAAEMTEAANLSSELADKLEQCIGVGRRVTEERQRRAEEDAKTQERDDRTVGQNRRTNLQWALGALLTIALAIGGGYVWGAQDDGPGKTGTTGPSRSGTTR